MRARGSRFVGRGTPVSPRTQVSPSTCPTSHTGPLPTHVTVSCVRSLPLPHPPTVVVSVFIVRPRPVHEVCLGWRWTTAPPDVSSHCGPCRAPPQEDGGELEVGGVRRSGPVR